MELFTRRESREAIRRAEQENRFGPRTAQEACNWPCEVWQSILAASKSGLLPPGYLDRLRATMVQGISCSSAYSGVAGDILGCQFMVQEMLRTGFLPEDAMGLVWVHCGDLDPSCQKALCSFKKPWQPHHVTRDIMERLPSSTAAWLEKTCPDAYGDPEFYEAVRGHVSDLCE